MSTGPCRRAAPRRPASTSAGRPNRAGWTRRAGTGRSRPHRSSAGLEARRAELTGEHRPVQARRAEPTASTTGRR
ncbi:hypothetical protein K7G98_12020 [Saccharothrix sp. MB29]|nr:hypothetical protein [Saccharothrix sp. MB29]